MKKIRQFFISGLLALLPLFATFYIIYYLFTFLDNFLGRYVQLITGKSIPGIGILAGIFLIFLAGFIVTNIIGAKLLNLAEGILKKIPFVTKIYFGVKQVLQAFSLQRKEIFRQVVLVEYPRKESYAVGFITGKCRGEVQEKTAKNLVNVFIPTTPNPTSGMLILVAEEEIIYLDMTVEEGLKLIISAGVVVPDSINKS